MFNMNMLRERERERARVRVLVQDEVRVRVRVLVQDEVRVRVRVLVQDEVRASLKLPLKEQRAGRMVGMRQPGQDGKKVSWAELWKSEPHLLNPGCLQYPTKPVQLVLLGEGGVTSLHS